MATVTVADGKKARSERLDELDDLLLRIRRVFQRPGYREELLRGLSRDMETATLRLLRVVQRAHEAPSVGAVAELLSIDPSTASRLVEGAVESGLLERQACPNDRRRARLKLSKSGYVVLSVVTSRRRELLATVTDAWKLSDLDQLVRLLDLLEAGFDQLESSA